MRWRDSTGEELGREVVDGSELRIMSWRNSFSEAMISSAHPMRAERGLRISCLWESQMEKRLRGSCVTQGGYD